MNYNFDEIINRNGTDSVKWDAVESRWGRNDLIPMWVADMDFRTAPFVIEALRKRLEHEVLGYTFACKEWSESIVNWVKERHGWTIREEMLTFTPGIVRGLAFVIQCFTQKGDKVMVMPPVYHPFFLVTQKNEREVVYSPLVLKDGQYYIDFDRFRRDVQGCKLLILSNPHNPGGRVWTKEELSKIATNYAIIDKGQLVKELSREELEATCREHIEIKMEHPDLALPVLDALGFKDYRVADENTIHIFERLNESGKITMELSRKNIYIHSISVTNESIEDYFLRLTGGVDHA